MKLTSIEQYWADYSTLSTERKAAIAESVRKILDEQKADLDKRLEKMIEEGREERERINNTLYHYEFYVLIDPLSNLPFYLGITRDGIDNRLKGHLRETERGDTAPNRQKREVIKSLLDIGLQPRIEKIDEMSVYGRELQKVYQHEQYLIQHYLDNGHHLLNMAVYPDKAIQTQQQATIQTRSFKNE